MTSGTRFVIPGPQPGTIFFSPRHGHAALLRVSAVGQLNYTGIAVDGDTLSVFEDVGGVAGAYDCWDPILPGDDRRVGKDAAGVGDERA